MLLCGIGAKPVAHLMQYHLLQWEVAKVKQLMTSNMTLTVLNLHQKTPKGATTKIQVKLDWANSAPTYPQTGHHSRHRF